MSARTIASLKLLGLSLLLLALFTAGQQAARAAEVNVAGYTNGCFNCTSAQVPNTSAPQSATVFGLSYINSTFSGTTSGGFLGIGSNPIAPPTQNVDNLGALSLANSVANYNGNTFTLRVTFTAPAGITGGNSRTFTATLTGSVSGAGNGGIFLDIDNTPQTFTFTNGSFTLSVNDVAIDPGQTVSLTGQITSATSTPASVTGRVTDSNGNGLSGVIVTLSGTNTFVRQTDQSGNYSVSLAAGGTYSVTPSSPYYVFTPARADFTNLNGSQTANFAAVPGALPTPTPPLTDDFSGNQRDPTKWNLGTVSQPAAVDLTVTVVQQNGQLQITPLANAQGAHYNGYVSVNSFDFTNAQVSVEVPQAATGGAETIFGLGSDNLNNYRFMVGLSNSPAFASFAPAALAEIGVNEVMLVLVFQVRIAGVVTQEVIPYDPVAHRFWRFRHDAPANAILFETSPDSNVYTERYRKTLDKSVSALAVELTAGTAAPTSGGGSAIFDNLALVTSTAQFASANVTVAEDAGRATITITRSGNVAGTPATLTYATVDNPAAVRCDNTQTLPGVAFARCDYATKVDTLSFAAGETAKSFSVSIIDDSFVEGDETFQLKLLTATGASLGAPGLISVTITDNDQPGQPNPVFASPFFIRQHYLDFLAREPDAGGFNAYLNLLTNCQDVNNVDPNAPAAACDRITVSGAFFGSPEFKDKGIYTIVFYRAALNRLPKYAEFAQDLSAVTGRTGAEAATKRAAFAQEFSQRAEFTALYPATLTNAAYVDALLSRYQLAQVTTPDPQSPESGVKVTLSRADLVNALNTNTLTRAQVLRAVMQSNEVSQQAEALNAFVAAQYYGYLRRTPDVPGFNAWVNYLTTHPGDFRTMVNGFVNSQEYRLRFGQP